MGVTIAQTRVACNTSTGDQTITTSALGGLTPKAAMFIATRATSDGTAADGAGMYIGFTDGTASANTGAEDQHAQGSSNVGGHSSYYCIEIFDGTAEAVVDGYATFGSWTTNGITINWGDAPSSAWLLTVVFFAGTDLSAYVGEVDLGNTVDLLTDITVVGFEPDVVLALFHDTTTPSLAHPFTFGVVHNNRSGTVTQRGQLMRARDGRATMDVTGIIRNDCGPMSGANASEGARTVFSAFDSSGFSVTTANQGAGNYDLLFLALRFGSSPVVSGKVYSFTVPAVTTGSYNDTGPGFKPQFMLYLGGLHEAWNTWDSATKAGSFSIHTITAGAQYSHAWNTEDGAADSNTQSISDDQHVIVKLHDGSAAYAATFTEFISTGVTANWSDVETANKYWPALAIQEFTSSSITLTVAEIAHANALDATGKLPQVHKLVPGEVIHANALDAPALSQVHKLTAPDIIHANALDAIGALPMSKTLVVSEIAHANALDAAGKLVQVHKLTLAEVSHSNILDVAGKLSQVHKLTVAEVIHANSLDAVVLSTMKVLQVAEIAHANILDGVTTTKRTSLSVAEIAHANILDAFAISKRTSLAVAEIAHANILDVTGKLAQLHKLTVAEAAHANALDVTGKLIQLHKLTVAEVFHANALDVAGKLPQAHKLVLAEIFHANTLDATGKLSQAHKLVLAEILHANALDARSITQAHKLSLADAAHANALDVAGKLGQIHRLVLADAAHSNSLDAVVLAKIYNLVLAEIAHANSLDTRTLSQIHKLVLSEIAHAHALDPLNLSGAILLSIMEILHSHSLDTKALTQAHYLIPADASSANALDGLNLTLTLLIQSLFRWRHDDGDEDGATWAAGENANYSVQIDTPVRLRMQIDTDQDANPSAFRLEYRKVGTQPWKVVK